ncbi:GNAT family N-acetyltransferase [Arthrobacter sp. zg-Y820]|uniref:GNAT family N-acetyltransferase n=1 Tax=unclassified Arthrobacter TaxID=235627 RepID=UPI001E5D086F|nr:MULTISPECIES: GNAT family N-acetyltransferase [unclassified Arthrobacter]MCC9198085.1 GNAT family N-acetyltransferase [Arthrobacter sp. zg-Y820]MDK1280952.1 GNAT family N-acetyltransferase [Arthrobacter sp. zg.Y820]
MTSANIPVRNISVRPPVESDADRLAAIHIAAWRAAYRGVMSDEYLDGLDSPRYADNWRRNILNPSEGTVHLVAQAGDEVVGFAVVGPATDNPEPGTGQVYAINLHPDWWANGIGSVLFAAAEETLISLGYDRACLWVEATNERAITFYTKRGWLDDGGTMQDTRFDPPVAERRHSRQLSRAE